MVQVFSNTYTGSESGISGSYAHIDVTSAITGSVLITDVHLSLTNVDLYNSNSSNDRDTHFDLTDIYRYINDPDKPTTGPTKTVTGSQTDNTANIEENTSTTVSGPLKLSATDYGGGMYAEDHHTVSIRIEATDGDISFDGSFDWEAVLAGRQML